MSSSRTILTREQSNILKAKSYKWNRAMDENNHNQGGVVCETYIPHSIFAPTLPMLDRRHTEHVPYAKVLGSMRSVFYPNIDNLPNDTFQTFSWEDQANNCSAESSSRKASGKEVAKKEIDNYLFLYFRIRKNTKEYLNYTVTEIHNTPSKKSTLYCDELLDKWTIKIRFRMMKSACMKEALLAFQSRFGLINDTNIMFCTDGFYGDSYMGRIGNPFAVPLMTVMPACTPIALGLHNGCSIFVSHSTDETRRNVFAQIKFDLAQEEEMLSNSSSKDKDILSNSSSVSVEADNAFYVDDADDFAT